MTPCEICGKNPATMHLTSVINGEKTEMNICASCAQEHHVGFAQAFDIGQLLSGFMQEAAAPVQTTRGAACPNCGMTYGQFKQGGLLGCADCYETFTGYLEPLLNRIHGRARHVGKIPSRAGGEMKFRREIERLSEQMRLAVSQEQFEEAARLRDQIRSLQAEEEKAKGDAT